MFLLPDHRLPAVLPPYRLCCSCTTDVVAPSGLERRGGNSPVAQCNRLPPRSALQTIATFHMGAPKNCRQGNIHAGEGDARRNHRRPPLRCGSHCPRSALRTAPRVLRAFAFATRTVGDRGGSSDARLRKRVMKAVGCPDRNRTARSRAPTNQGCAAGKGKKRDRRIR